MRLNHLTINPIRSFAIHVILKSLFKKAIDEAKRLNSLDASMERFRRSVGSSTLSGLTGTPTESLHGAIVNLWQEMTDAQT